MRKAIAGLLRTYWEFIQHHPFISLVIALLVGAASVGGLYLLIVNLPPWLILPCFTGGCQ
jgi:hypothetical protein